MNATLTILTDLVHDAAHPLSGATHDCDPLLELIGDARLVLLGEATHGTHEFYHERAQITKRLILEKGFTGIAVEADWPDAYRRRNRPALYLSSKQIRGAFGTRRYGGRERSPSHACRRADEDRE